MKILWTLDSPFFPVHGGSARVVYHQASIYAKQGVPAYAFCRDKSSTQECEAVIEGVQTFSFSVNSTTFKENFFRSILNGRKAFKKMIEKEGDFDLILFNQPLTALATKSFFNKVKSKKIYSFHSPFSSEYLIRHSSGGVIDWFRGKFLNCVERIAMSGCDLIVFDSEYMEKEAIRVHPSLESRSRLVIPLGVDLEHFKCKTELTIPRKKIGLSLNRPIVFTVRNLEPRMGLERLIRAWAQVAEALPEVLLVLGGEGSLKEGLKELIKEYALEKNVLLVGYIKEDELPSYYQAADLFVLPTIELEGFGLVTIEALACGTPVLGTKVGATPEVLSALNSDLIFSSRRTKVIAERIIQFFNNKEANLFTPEVCRQYVEEKFSLEKHLDQLSDILTKLNKVQF